MNVLLVGLGRWGEKHFRVLTDLGLTVWVADPRPERTAWARARGVPAARVAADFRDLLGAVDAVDVVTPADRHQAVAEAALASGRPCFVEKPLAPTAAAARRLAALAREHAALLQVGHVFRFHPVTAALREVLAEGRLGAVRFVTGRFASFKRPRADVGVTRTDAIHFLDLFAHLLDRPASRALAVQTAYLDPGRDDLALAVIHYGDVPALVEAHCFGPEPARACVVVGERGSAAADFAAGTLTLHRGHHRPGPGGWEAVETGKESRPVADDEPLRRELAAFRAACQTGGPSPVPGEAGVHALEIAEAVERAARLGRAVAVGGSGED